MEVLSLPYKYLLISISEFRFRNSFYFSDFNIDLDQFQETVRNQVINFKVDLGDDFNDQANNLGDKILSRRSSLVIHKTDQDHVEDTFDQILKVCVLFSLNLGIFYCLIF